MMLSSTILRRVGIAAIASLALTSAAVPGVARMRAQMADKIATNAANQLVTKINGESCSANSQARSDFVNIVAGPLLNKMIDCNMLPGGM